MTDPDLKATPLCSRHAALGALMAPFGGWNMPIQYEGIIAEHKWCREKAALFDICHMGEFVFEGDFDSGGLEDVFTFRVSTIPVGRSRYGFLLNEDGGIVDDLIVFRVSEQKAMIVVNAATADNDFAVIGSRLTGGTFSNISSGTAKLDIQGPLAREVMQSVAGEQVSALPYFRFAEMELLGSPAIVSRTGYTGELGYEIFLPAGKAGELWDVLLKDSRVKPAGLGARDLLRLEMGYSLYGSDIDSSTTPFEADLAAFVDMNKEFVGKPALVEQSKSSLKRRKVAFRVNGRRTPRHGFALMFGETRVGEVASGGFSPVLGCGIGLGYVSPEFSGTGTRLVASQERASMDIEVCSTPFLPVTSLRN